MQEEVTQKTIALSMKTGKLTAQALQAALKKYLQHRVKGPKLHRSRTAFPSTSCAMRIPPAFTVLNLTTACRLLAGQWTRQTIWRCTPRRWLLAPP